MRRILSIAAFLAVAAVAASAGTVDISYRGAAHYGVTGSLAIDLSYDSEVWADFQRADGLGYHDAAPEAFTLSYSIRGAWDDYTFGNSSSALASHYGYEAGAFGFDHHDYGAAFLLHTVGGGDAPGDDLVELLWGTFDHDDRYPAILYTGDWSLGETADVAPVPLPAAGLLLLAGLGSLGAARRRTARGRLQRPSLAISAARSSMSRALAAARETVLSPS